MKKRAFKTNTLYHLANEYRKRALDESELEKIDMTEVLEQEEEYMIKNGEIILENINGKMRLGKSTMAMARAKRIHGLIKKYKNKDIGDFGVDNIARDDQEFSKMMRNPNLHQTIIVTDESNELEQTGENVTVENALKKVFSDVQAGRYVHRICCSPKDNVDPNADILLSIIATDKKSMKTRSKLYYRFFEGGAEYTQLLGYVDTYVGGIIGKWIKVKDIFLKPNKNKSEQKMCSKMIEKDWYTHYMYKKYEKMELITKEGIFKPRVLDYAQAILNVTKELKPMTRLTTMINHNIVRNFVKLEFRKAKLPTSIVGEELATREAMGLLDVWKGYHKVVKSIEKLDKDIVFKKLNGTSLEMAEEKLKGYMEMKNKLALTAKLQEEELEHYARINKKYNEVMEKNEKGIHI